MCLIAGEDEGSGEVQQDPGHQQGHHQGTTPDRGWKEFHPGYRLPQEAGYGDEFEAESGDDRFSDFVIDLVIRIYIIILYIYINGTSITD